MHKKVHLFTYIKCISKIDTLIKDNTDAEGKIIFTRSEEEKRLCSILTRWGILFQYEKDYPANNEAGCDFFETRYGNLTPPGILITKDMTAQDVERMRENRRRARQGGLGLPQ